MATQDSSRQIVDLPIAPEVALDLARWEIERTRLLLPELSDADWHRPTVLPFWRVCEVVGHIYVVGGFFNSATGLITSGVPDRQPVRAVLGAAEMARPVVLGTLHRANIEAPRLFSLLAGRRALVGLTGVALRALDRRLGTLTRTDLSTTLPFYGSRLSMAIYLAAMIKELAVHRWEIEQALDPTSALDARSASLLPALLWATAPLASRPHARLRGTVAAHTGNSHFVWRADAGCIRPLTGMSTADAAITAPADTFALVAYGRLPVEQVHLAGNSQVGRDFLSAFSYRAGPMPFFNP